MKGMPRARQDVRPPVTATAIDDGDRLDDPRRRRRRAASAASRNADPVVIVSSTIATTVLGRTDRSDQPTAGPVVLGLLADGEGLEDRDLHRPWQWRQRPGSAPIVRPPTAVMSVLEHGSRTAAPTRLGSDCHRMSSDVRPGTTKKPHLRTVGKAHRSSEHAVSGGRSDRCTAGRKKNPQFPQDFAHRFADADDLDRMPSYLPSKPEPRPPQGGLRFFPGSLKAVLAWSAGSRIPMNRRLPGDQPPLLTARGQTARGLALAGSPRIHPIDAPDQHRLSSSPRPVGPPGGGKVPPPKGGGRAATAGVVGTVGGCATSKQTSDF